VYSDICTIAIKRFFDVTNTEHKKTKLYPELLLVLPYFNFAGFNQLYVNIQDALHSFNNQQINIIVMEAVLKGNVSQLYTLPCKVITTETNTIAFHKEGLFNKAFDIYKELYEVFVLCDSDIVFEDEKWPANLIQLMKSGAEILQPFATCAWTDKKGAVISTSKSYSYVKAECARLSENSIKHVQIDRDLYHPGFVWAFSKSFLLRTGGVFSKCFTGAGDLMLIYLAEGKPIPLNNEYKYLQPELNNFLMKGGGKQEAMKGKIYHLYHGSMSNRQYYNRHANILKAKVNLGPEFFSPNLDDYLIQAIHPKVNQINLAYFKARREDD
jgi:hypothetical protein